MIVALILLDQFTKGIVQQKFYLGESITIWENFFNLTYVRNPGAAFGFLAHAPAYIRKPLFVALPVMACFWLMYLIYSVRFTSLLLSFAYSLILAGAIGNLIDRISMDYVVDFLDFHYAGHHFPAFNVADIVITVAAGLLIIDFIKQVRKPTA